MAFKKTSQVGTIVKSNEYNLSFVGEPIAIELIYVLSDIAISSDNKGVARYSLIINGEETGDKRSFNFNYSPDVKDIFSYVEDEVMKLDEFSDAIKIIDGVSK